MLIEFTKRRNSISDNPVPDLCQIEIERTPALDFNDCCLSTKYSLHNDNKGNPIFTLDNEAYVPRNEIQKLLYGYNSHMATDANRKRFYDLFPDDGTIQQLPRDYSFIAKPVGVILSEIDCFRYVKDIKGFADILDRFENLKGKVIKDFAELNDIYIASESEIVTYQEDINSFFDAGYIKYGMYEANDENKLWYFERNDIERAIRGLRNGLISHLASIFDVRE